MNNPATTSLPALSRFSLEGRVAFLSGAAGHLGTAMALALGGAGAHVILNGRNAGKLEALTTRMKEQGMSVSVQAFDVTDEAAVNQAAVYIQSSYGRLDILVNNAYAGAAGTLQTATLADFMSAYQVSVGAVFTLLQRFTPLLQAAAKHNAGGASVINIGSMYGSVSPDPSIYGDSGKNNPPYYGAAKAGLLQLTRYAACHLAPERIRVNCISPGPFPLADIAEAQPEFHQALCNKNPMGRIGQAEELAGPLLFLASDAASYVTGINLPVDGGWTSW